ncbi:MAG: xylulokinase [Candidatus Izemoplasmataceae bacterium]
MYIGIDLGTSSVKCILVTTQGKIIKTVSKQYELIMPKPSWSEQNPLDWYQQTISALKDLVVGYESAIKGISFSGQMHGLVLLDKYDNILRNAILWNDQRTVKEVDYLNNVIGIEKLLKYNGNIALTGLTAPKILWVRNNEPHIFKNIDKIMLPKDYLVYRLTGAFASDVSDMSGSLFFDPRTKTYSSQLLSIIGIKPSQLPQVHESHEVVGTLLPEIKQNLNISHDVNVSVGGGDQAVGAIGIGIVDTGECSISLGTSGVVFVSSDEFVVDDISHLQSYAHANGKYHIMAVMLNAAGAVRWWKETILHSSDYDNFYANLESSNNKENLFFLPYLTGERAPINDPDAKGVLFGLNLRHTQNDINRAVVEGVTFALRDSFELIKNLGVPIERIRITGGGAKSGIWAQMIADILNVEVLKVVIEEGPALGAAILSMVGNNVYKDVQQACETLVELSTPFTPNADTVSIYQEKYNTFKKLYPNMKSLFKTI